MNSVDFIRDAVRTEAPITEETEYRMTQAARALHGAMGLCTEAGELMDAYKKHIFYGKELDVTNVKEELGDVLWYVAELCDVYNFTFEEIMELCIAKLRKRYPQRFTSDAALNRNLIAERCVLEQDEMQKHTKEENEEIINCPVCGGSGFSGQGTGYDDVCSNCIHGLVLRESPGSIQLPGIPLTTPVPPIVHKEIPYDPRDSEPLKVVGSPYKNLIALFGEDVVFAERRKFGEDFFNNMKRSASIEDVEMFYFRWWKSELRKQERPEIRVR
jgi:NTP pyrophosphatase (non-canonical NTP hydrolase)